MTKVRLVLADDHPMVRFGIAAVLHDVGEVEVVGEAADGHELLRLVAEHQPDVVLTDLSMPGMNGVTAIRELRQRWPDVGVLVLTMHGDDGSVRDALSAGASGYLLKGAGRDELAAAVRAVAAGQSVYARDVASRLVDGLVQETAMAPAFPDLTPRESEVLELLAAGSRTSHIARALGMSEKTVRNHTSSILLKLQVHDRTAAAVKARAAGMGRSATGS